MIGAGIFLTISYFEDPKKGFCPIYRDVEMPVVLSGGVCLSIKKGNY